MFFREWFTVFCVLCCVLSLVFVKVFPSRVPVFGESSVCFRKIQVEVLGAVERPGIYEVDVGASIHSVLLCAGLKKTADKSAVYLKKKLLSSCSLTVPEKKCRKSKKKKQSSSSIALTSYVNEDSGNPFKMSAL